MKFLGYAYRFASNFVFLAAVYYSLNLLEKYPQRAVLAVLILVYAGMHAASALAGVPFLPAHRAAGRRGAAAGDDCGGRAERGASRKQIVGDVAELRHAGEMKSYIDLLFLALVILLCIAKIVTN